MESATKLPGGTIGLGEAWLVEHIRYSVHELELNRVITAVGPPGSGKSWGGLRIGPMVDASFNIERVVFPGLDYIRAIADPKLGVGAFVEWDDAGLGAPAREFWSELNRAVGMIAQSSRFRRLILWVTLPDKSFLDSQPRKLVDIHLEFVRREKKEDPFKARVYLPETNAKTGKIYYWHPRIDAEDGQKVLEMIEFRTPPAFELSEQYVARKARYMMGFYRETVERIETGGLKMNDRTAKTLILLADYGAQLKKTHRQIAAAIGIHEDSFGRALRKARAMTGLGRAEDEPGLLPAEPTRP